MSDKGDKDRVDKATLSGQRTYRVSSRMLENFPQISFLVSPSAHSLYHLQLTLFPEAVKKEKLKPEEIPNGFKVLDRAIVMQFNRDLANFARNTFHSATLEELVAAKFGETKIGKKKVEMI